MYVRISPNSGEPQDFEFDVDFHRATDEVRDVIRKAIYDATQIQPKDQNAVFFGSSISGELRSLKKLDLPPGVAEKVKLPKNVKTHFKENYGSILEISTAYVTNIDVWDEDDFTKEENRMKVFQAIDASGPFLGSLYKQLNSPRTIEGSLLDCFPDFRDRINQPDSSLRRFLNPVSTESSRCSVSLREMKCYDEIFHNIYDDIDNLPSEKKYDSSSMRTLFFGSAMIKPPLFYKHPLSQQLVMPSDRSSELQLFVTEDDKSDMYKYAPRSDFIIIDKSSDLPILITVVDSKAEQKDSVGIVFQGVVACRQWRYALPEALKEQNRVLGLFVGKDFHVELYLFHANEQNYVRVYNEMFVLRDKNRALQLARILFNYRDRYADLAGKSEKEKLDELGALRGKEIFFRPFSNDTEDKVEDGRPLKPAVGSTNDP